MTEQSILDKSKLKSKYYHRDWDAFRACTSYIAKSGLYEKHQEMNEITITLNLRDIKILEEGIEHYQNYLHKINEGGNNDPNFNWNEVYDLEMEVTAKIRNKLEEVQKPIFEKLSIEDVALMCHQGLHELAFWAHHSQGRFSQGYNSQKDSKVEETA